MPCCVKSLLLHSAEMRGESKSPWMLILVLANFLTFKSFTCSQHRVKSQTLQTVTIYLSTWWDQNWARLVFSRIREPHNIAQKMQDDIKSVFDWSYILIDHTFWSKFWACCMKWDSTCTVVFCNLRFETKSAVRKWEPNKNFTRNSAHHKIPKKSISWRARLLDYFVLVFTKHDCWMF